MLAPDTSDHGYAPGLTSDEHAQLADDNYGDLKRAAELISRATDLVDGVSDRLKANCQDHKHLHPVIDVLGAMTDALTEVDEGSPLDLPPIIEMALPGRWKECG